MIYTGWKWISELMFCAILFEHRTKRFTYDTYFLMSPQNRLSSSSSPFGLHFFLIFFVKFFKLISVSWVGDGDPIFKGSSGHRGGNFSVFNTDGTVSADDQAASGGLIRNHTGGFFAGFHRRIGRCSILAS